MVAHIAALRLDTINIVIHELAYTAYRNKTLSFAHRIAIAKLCKYILIGVNISVNFMAMRWGCIIQTFVLLQWGRDIEEAWELLVFSLRR